jgi:hypothetical protein
MNTKWRVPLSIVFVTSVRSASLLHSTAQEHVDGAISNAPKKHVFIRVVWIRFAKNASPVFVNMLPRARMLVARMYFVTRVTRTAARSSPMKVNVNYMQTCALFNIMRT